MACPKDGTPLRLVLLCDSCGHISDEIKPSYSDLIAEVATLRKFLEDIIEKKESHEIEDKVKKYLDV